MSTVDYQIGAEGDLKSSANKQIWLYFVIFSIILAATVFGLVVMFRFQLLYETEQKVGKVVSHEAVLQKAKMEALLNGKIGLFADKKHGSIDAAMSQFLHAARK